MPIRTALLLSLLLTPAARADAPAAAEGPSPVRVLGELALARGQLGFAPCERAAHAVQDGTRGELLATLARITGGVDGAVFAEIETVEGEDGVVTATKLRRAYRDGPRCDEQPGSYIWQARGHEPEWELLATRRTIRVQRPGERMPWFFPFQAFVRGPDGVYRHSAEGARGSFAIALVPGRCHDAVRGAASDFSAEVTLAGTIVLRGCAWNGLPRTVH